MKNVQMAENKEEQNLVACQVKNIFENIMVGPHLLDAPVGPL